MAHDWKATTGYAHSVASTIVREHKKSGIEVQRRRDRGQAWSLVTKEKEDPITAYLDNKITRGMARS